MIKKQIKDDESILYGKFRPKIPFFEKYLNIGYGLKVKKTETVEVLKEDIELNTLNVRSVDYYVTIPVSREWFLKNFKRIY